MAAKGNRPRLDAIKRHIIAGSYDDVLWEIQAAIDERNRRRQDAVNKLVKEVYGDDFQVVPKRAVVEGRARQPGEVLPGESPHVQAPGADNQPGTDDDGLDDDPNYESRSPIIGSVE